MKYLRYTGEFLSRAGITWRVDIMQEADAPFEKIGVLEFPADAPLVLEWSREEKENVICGSAATLKIISPGDRTYEDLYTIEVGAILLDVYRNGKKYWSGAIDPEFYEEPYETAAGYEVSLTFSDFGILDRIKYDLSGIQTLRDIMLYAIARAGLSCALDSTHVTTTFEDGTSIAGGGLSIRSENFIDEDGEASTLYEVLEGILQPLAIRMVQRDGCVYLYDLNGLYTQGEAKAIEWDGDSQTMGTDKVANNVVVSFSPYSSAELLSDEIAYGGAYDVEHKNLTSSWPSGQTSQEFADYSEYYSYYPDYDPSHKQGSNWDYNLIDFTIFLHSKGTGIKNLGAGCKYFHILPVTGGSSETSGVAYAFRTGGHGGISTGWPQWKVHSSVPRPNGASVLTTNRVFLPKLDDVNTKKYKVRITQEVLIDARYNPLSGSSTSNDCDNDNTVKTRSAFVFIPAKITLYDAEGNALYHYSNKATTEGATKGHLAYSKGEWVAGADPGGDCWLEYYNADDLKEDAGIRGWKGNRHNIGRPDGKGGRMGTEIYDSFKKMEDGEYMPYPPVSGYLEVEILAGVYGYDYGQKVDACAFGSTESQWDKSGIYGKLRWCLYKVPKVDVVNNNLIFDSAELEDVEYSGYLNRSAKEEISIDTICGTASRVCPTAKGIYHRTSNGQQLQVLKRAGVIDHPEKLLIGTLYSQYADRKTTLSGEAVIDTGLHYYTEANQEGKRFMLMGDTQDLIADCTEAEYCEFRPDEYDSIEEV